MKHEPNIIAVLVAIFAVSQLLGLVITDRYLDYGSLQSGEAEYKDLPFDTQRPDVEQSHSYIWIMVAVLVGTALVMAIIRFGKMRLWKAWYFLSVVVTLTVALAAFFHAYVALAAAVILAYLKINKPAFWVHNISEIFIYGGLAAIFAPMINIFSALMLLLFISLYDMYAVWKSEHMITLAKSQTEQKLFAGLMVPYHKGESSKIAKPGVKTKKVKNAILGGGDVGFPLIFSAVVMKTLLMHGIPRLIAFAETSIIVITTTLALVLLLQYGKKDRFYPAMPFLSAGCLAGYVLIFILNRIIVI